MKTLFVALALASTLAVAEDTRQLVPMPPAAQESLRQEMLDNLVAVNEVLSLMAEGKVKEAGEAAEAKLGVSAMGKHQQQAFRQPGPARACRQPCMASVSMAGHKAVSEFAAVAKTGNRDKALALLPNITSACVGCHFSYRTR